MTPARLDEIRQIVLAGERGSITILPSLRVAASELLAALDDEIAGRGTLRCNDVRLELLATTPAEAHAAINALFARIEIPVGPMYERDRLREQVASLTPKWQEGEPPDGPVWREGVDYPVRVKRSERYGLMYWDDGFRSWKADHGEPQPRWAPIPKPTEG